MKGSIAWSYVIVWVVVAIGSAYVSIVNLSQWHTNRLSERSLAVAAGLACIASVIRVGNNLGWWSILYGPRH